MKKYVYSKIISTHAYYAVLIEWIKLIAMPQKH